MNHVRRVPLADQAAGLLLDRIRSGEWPLGARLPGETTLGPQLGVGRSTVREAIRQLAGKGVLETRQGAGVFVTALDVTEDWNDVLRRAGIVSVIEARIAIETEAAAHAADRRTPQALRALRRALAERQEGHGGTEDYVDADMRFHRAVVAASGNPVLLELFDTFVPRLRQAMIDMLRLGSRLDDDTDHAAHADLVEAIADRDAEAAHRLSRTHLDALKAGLGQPGGRRVRSGGPGG
ncbi:MULTISPECIES: FadR/GntR family transcriptional regulator [unclassified Streptomyces]|uniref:FadR/GntR family transcriptional regulator n=1 Tax=unclassified Streptomyces TaxID=2593676 RepID=UPI002240E748|nr:FadR/GntR family transcriptional regulator [Streptomyces sp. SHP 1-2]MCW5253625.1 FadR family transcriptional regulator [Streptomyces sp. SHP 1-2]